MSELPHVSPVWRAIAGWCVGNRLAVFLAAALLGLLGLVFAPFEARLGPVPRSPVAVDVLPEVGENQQIVFSEWPGRSPRDVEDQVTYPLTTVLLGLPGVRTVRSTSAFGFSSIYVVFEDEVEFYWSRSRILEKLASLPDDLLPEGVTPRLGPDATGLGQIFWYTLEGRDEAGNPVGGWSPQELRTIQDWTVRQALQAADGVAEVASVGGFVQEYQVDVDPEALAAHDVGLEQVIRAVRESNLDVGARTLEINRVEYVVRSLGLVKEVADLEEVVVATRDHTPIRLREVASVVRGPAARRGALDDAGAPAVGGVVVARYGANPLATIEAVKAALERLEPGLPSRVLEDGTVSRVRVVPFYDRTELIHETLDTLEDALWHELLITALVVLVLLRDLRSSVLVLLTVPLGVLGAFVLMKATGVSANVMALAGIAIAIGTMVDMAIVFSENIGRGLEEGGPAQDRARTVATAAAEVAPAVLTSSLTTVVSFLPVFGLAPDEARMFAPLALTKTFALLAVLVLTVLVLPPLAHWVLRDRPVGAGAEGPRRLLRAEHLRDWVLVAVGLYASSSGLWLGLVPLLMGGWRLGRPWMGAPWPRLLADLELGLAASVAIVVLARVWVPLGHGAGDVPNLVFVAVVAASVLVPVQLFVWVYPALLAALLRRKLAFLSVPLGLVGLGLFIWLGAPEIMEKLGVPDREEGLGGALAARFPGLGREYMPPFDEGAYLFMPSTLPHASIGQATEMLSAQDAAIAAIPEVDRVVGKVGRVDSALDPAPISMVETVVTYVPEYRIEDDGTRVRQWRDHIHSPTDIWREIVQAGEHPGMTSAPVLQPIAARLVMLQSGMRAPLGLKVSAPDLETAEAFGREIEAVLEQVEELRPETVFADRMAAKPYLELEVDREAIGRYGLTVGEVQRLIQTAVGGRTVTRTVEGRERHAVRIRYMREERDSVEALHELEISTPKGHPVPLSELAELRYVRGPQMIRSEDTFPTAYVIFDRKPGVGDVDAVEAAARALEDAIARGELEVPAGVSYRFAGTYEQQVRASARLLVLIPVALIVVFVLLQLQFRRLSTTFAVFFGVAVAMAGGFMLLWLYGQPWFLSGGLLGVDLREVLRVEPVKLSVAVWIGFIALIGIATDDGVVMATYLDQRLRDGARAPASVAEIRARVVEAGSRRVRPCLMTTATTLLALLPVVTSDGRGADLMRPMALPVLGGMAVELITLFVVPVLYCLTEELRLWARQNAEPRPKPGQLELFDE